MFSYFPLKTGFDIAYKLSPMETICMKCQILCPGKNKKNISNMSSADNFNHSAKIKTWRKHDYTIQMSPIVKTKYLLTCVPYADSNQTVHRRSLVIIFLVRMCPWLSKIRVKILIRLYEWRCWSESSLFALVRRYVFWRCGSNKHFNEPLNCKHAEFEIYKIWSSAIF